MVGPDLELGVEPEEQESVAGEPGRGVAAWEGRDGVLDHPGVGLGTDLGGVHDAHEAHAVEAGGVAGGGEGHVRAAHVEEVGAEAADELLDDDLDEAGEEDGPEGAEDGAGGVAGRLDAPLGDDINEHGNEDGDDAGEPRREDPAAEGVRPLGVDNVARLGEGDGKGARDGDGREVDLGPVSECSLDIGGSRRHTPVVRPLRTNMQTRSRQVTLSHSMANVLHAWAVDCLNRGSVAGGGREGISSATSLQ